MATRQIQHQRKEQQFFEDPAIDRMMGTVMALATEVYVLRERLSALENQLAGSDLVDIGSLREAPDADEASAASTEAKAFSEALLRPLLGLQDAVGATK